MYIRKENRAILPINTLANLCGYFFNSALDSTCNICTNNGYNCNHPDCEEIEDGIGNCLISACPLCYKADEEDCAEFGIDYDEDDDYVITNEPSILAKLKE